MYEFKENSPFYGIFYSWYFTIFDRTAIKILIMCGRFGALLKLRSFQRPSHVFLISEGLTS